MSGRREFRLRGWILLAVVPSLLLATAGWSFFLYHAMHGSIVQGFDRMLHAYSATLGAWIDGEGHAELARPRRLAGLHRDDTRGRLVALDAESGELLAISPEGRAEPVAATGLSRPRGLTSAGPDAAYYTLETGHDIPRLTRLDPRTGQATTVAPAPPGASLLSRDGEGERIWIYADGIFTAVDPASPGTPAGESAWTGPALTGLAPAPRGGGLVALTAQGDLYAVRPGAEDPPAGPMARGPDLTAAEPPADSPPLDPPLRGLAAGPVPDTWHTATGRLLTFRPRSEEAAEITALGIGHYYNEPGALYRRYADPMERVFARSGLTYLYTQILDPEPPGCTYILDATPGEDHSPIGARDVLPGPDYRGGRRVMEEGMVHTGDVQPTEQWGLIKVSYAPIHHADGRIQAMAGADVNVGVIREKNREAVFSSVLVGLVAVLLAGGLSLFTARRLTHPLTVVKDGALRMAAGEPGHRIELRRPLEMRRLAEGFNHVAGALERTLEEERRTAAELERAQRRRHLAAVLDSPPAAWASGSSAGALANPAGAEKTASGWVATDAYEAAWFCAPESDPLVALRQRAVLGRTIQGLLEVYGDDVEDLYREFERLKPESMRLCWFRRRGARDIHVASPGPARAGLFDGGVYQQPLETEPGEGMVLNPGQCLLLTTEEDLLEADTWSEPPAGARAEDIAPDAAARIEARIPDRQAVVAVFGFRDSDEGGEA